MIPWSACYKVKVGKPCLWLHCHSAWQEVAVEHCVFLRIKARSQLGEMRDSKGVIRWHNATDRLGHLVFLCILFIISYLVSNAFLNCFMNENIYFLVTHGTDMDI